MAHPNLQDAYLLEKVTDPNSLEFQQLMGLLLTNSAEVEASSESHGKKSEFRYTFPFRGDPEDEMYLRDASPFKFPERGDYRNGLVSLAMSYADVIDLIIISSGRRKRDPTLVISQEAEYIRETVASSGTLSPMVFYCTPQDAVASLLQVKPVNIVFDHTSTAAPIDEVLSLAYRLGVKVVDGVFPYHVSAVRRWDVIAGAGKWSYTHTAGHLTVGPADDSSRLIRYKFLDYEKFLDPKKWVGKSRRYGYELRKSVGGLVTYRAVYLGDNAAPDYDNKMISNLPMCSSDDMVLVAINRDLAAGVYVSRSNNAQDLARLSKDYSIEVRKDLFVGCVDYLISKDKNPDLVGDAVRYITQHNYVDLVDGVRIVRCASLSYADALCVAMVCALTAYSLRYRLTSESLVDVKRHVSAAREYAAPRFGSLERLVWFMTDYVMNATRKLFVRSVVAAKSALYGSDYIPGVCFDVYMSTRYDATLDWYEPATMTLEADPMDKVIADSSTDPLVEFLAESYKTSAPTVERTEARAFKPAPYVDVPYRPNIVADPLVGLQDVYDQAFPGNSVSQIQNAAELRKVRDIDFSTEFFGKLETNKDVPANEQLHEDASLRTAALPVSQTPLVDAVLASAKRNFNPPDLQMQNDPWEYARYLVDKFVKFAFVENYAKTLGEGYRRNPITFNVFDYLEWRASRDKSYRSALESECPAELVELGLEKYDTIVKRRIKPKLSVAAQYELAQPQVIVSLSKKDTALFSSAFRKVFERFDAALRPEFASAGRMSDEDLSRWFTENMSAVLSLQCIEIDSSKYDKSQGLLARMIESLLFVELGLDPGVGKIFEDSWVGKVSSRSLGLMFISAYQMKSGAPHTMLGNIVYNMVSSMECIGEEKIKRSVSKGDDNLVWVLDGVDKSCIVSKFSSLFNLESKLISGSVPYFSSGYVLPLSDCVRFAPDPLKMLELLGERGQDETTLRERFVSFKDRVGSLISHHEVPRVLTTAVRLRMSLPELDVVHLVDCLFALSRSFEFYKEAAVGRLKNG